MPVKIAVDLFHATKKHLGPSPGWDLFVRRGLPLADSKNSLRLVGNPEIATDKINQIEASRFCEA